MAYAQFLAGMASASECFGYVHAMAHQLGGYNPPHGVCNAVLLPHVQVFNSKVAAARLRDCAAAMGVNVTGKTTRKVLACINAIRELAKKVDIPAGLRDLNVKEEDFAVLATNALKDAFAALLTRSRQLTKKLWRFIAQRCNHHSHNGWRVVSRFFNYLKTCFLR